MATRKSVRVQMLQETEDKLKELAIKYGCLYDGEPSISMLLNQITLGRLEIKGKIIPDSVAEKQKIFQLRIEIYQNIVGTIYVISETIANNKGNIISTRIKPHNNSGFLYILLSVQDDEKIANLVKELKEVKVESIEGYNSPTRLVNNIRSSDTAPIKLIEELRESALIISITLTIGLEIIATDEIGLLAKISKACAKKNFLISGVEQELRGKPNKISIRLHLYLEEQGEYEIPEQILEVSGLIEDIRHIAGIDSVERFAIESILE